MIFLSKEIKRIDAYFRAANYLSVGQLYLLDNPLLKRKLSFKDNKPTVKITSNVEATLLEYNCKADFIKNEDYIY